VLPSVLAVEILAGLVSFEQAAPADVDGEPHSAMRLQLNSWKPVMFANFELSRGGLVAADVKPKRTRTDLGCLPCMYSPNHVTQSDGLVRTSSCIARLYIAILPHS
jgi:hypothetical protein